MKLQITLTCIAVSLGFQSMAQLPASRTPQNRKVVLEEFTGINCTWCPDGHKLANALKNAKPAGDVVLINIHTGGFATPSGNQIDLRTTEGNAIAGMQGMGIAGYPTGAINRTVFTGSAMSMSRSVWAQYADTVLSKPSWVNVAAQATLNVATRLLTVEVEAYYTANSPSNSNMLTVALLENRIRGTQIGAQNLYPENINEDGTYNHNHTLRKIITPTFGDSINTTTTGTSFTKTYTYTVPASYVNVPVALGELELVVFVARTNTDIVSAAYAPITLTGITTTNDASVANIMTETEICAGNLTPSVRLTNSGSAPITSAEFTYSANGGTSQTFTANFNTPIKPFTSTTVKLNKITFTPSATNTINVSVSKVNTSSDEGTTGNSVTSNSIPLTTRLSSANAVFMEFLQDRYGSESSWEIIEEQSGAVIASDGPFSDLAANGVQLNTKVISGLQPNTCYVLRVKDSYGDGINSGTGAGNYKLKSGNTYLITSNGQFGSEDYKTFKTAATLTTQVTELNGAALELKMFPNPSDEMTTLSFDIAEKQTVTVEVFNILGERVYLSSSAYAAGSQRLAIDCASWAEGLYTVSIASDKMATKIGRAHV